MLDTGGIVATLGSGLGTLFASQQQYDQEIRLRDFESYLEATSSYREAIGVERCGDMNDLIYEVRRIDTYVFANNNISDCEIELLIEILESVSCMKNLSDIHPYEIPIIYEYKLLLMRLKDILNSHRR